MEIKVKELNNEGVELFLNGKLSEAKKKYHEALEISPENTTTLNNLGMVFLQEKEFDKAEKCFLEANKEKNNPIYLLNLGHVKANQNLFSEAENYYSKSIELNPTSLNGWKSLASLYQYQKKYRKSVMIWEDIVTNRSYDQYFIIQLVKDLIELKEFTQALNILSNISENQENQESIWYYTALIHLNCKNFGFGKEAINKCLAVSPFNEGARLLAATIYLGLSELDQALFHWNYLLNVNENNHKVRIDKAVALLAFGFKNEALNELDYVINKDDRNSKALFYKAMTLIEMNNKIEEAADILTKVKAGDNAFALKAKELLTKISA
jgi:tetratricopeptide (TPR) repeat protein